MKILMVCLGNICRSPLAEGILQNKVQENGLDWKIDSAGTGSWHVGQLPDPRSVQTAKEKGIDITQQRARQFKADDFSSFDLIFAMDSSNYRDILRLAPSPSDAEKVDLILNILEPGRNSNVPDPYYGGDDGFEKVFQMLDKACDKLIEKHMSVTRLGK